MSPLIFMVSAASTGAAPASKPATTQPAPAATQPDLTALEKDYRNKLTDGTDAPATLRTQAQTLLSLAKPQAITVLSQLLIESKVSATRVAICEAIALPVSQPGASAPAFTEPLLELLKNNDETLRRAAIAALRRYRVQDIPPRLGSMAGDTKLSLLARTAALEALAGISHENAVDALIPLLADKTPEIQHEVSRILREATDQALGIDHAKWQAWWKDNRGSWAHQKVIRLERKLAQSKQSTDQLRSDLTEAYRTIYNLTANGDKQKLHLEWFTHREATVKLLAMKLLEDSISEGKGKQVSPEMKTALHGLVVDASPRVRAKAATFFGVDVLFKSTADAQHLLGQLKPETDAAARAALIKALGQIKDPVAIPDLIQALADPIPEVRIEAVTALGTLGRKGSPTAAAAQPAIKEIHDRFGSVPKNDVKLTGAYLRAMADIGDPMFAPHFKTAIEAADATLREAAIRGLAGYGDAKDLDLMLKHLADPSPSVKQAAATAVGTLGADESALNPLRARVVDANETEAVRSEAWTAIKKVLDKLDLPAQLKFAESVRPIPARYIDLVTPIELKLAALPAEGETPNLRATVREALADALASVAQHDKASELFEKAYQHFVKDKNTKDRADTLARKYVTSLLASDKVKVAMEFAGSVTGNPDPATAAPMAATVQATVDQWLKAGQPERVLRLHAHWVKHLHPKLDAPARAKFDTALTGARAARIKALVPALAKPDAAGKAADAEIRAMAKAAVPHLAAELNTLVTAKTPNPAAEKAIHDLLKAVTGDWPGYDLAKATPEQKQAAIKPLLGGA